MGSEDKGLKGELEISSKGLGWGKAKYRENAEENIYRYVSLYIVWNFQLYRYFRHSSGKIFYIYAPAVRYCI